MTHGADGQLADGLRREFRRRLLTEQLPRISQCLELLSDSRVWQRPGPTCNSVGNLVLHLCGNTTQWILVPFGDGEDRRDRDAEFAADGGWDAASLTRELATVYTAACAVVDRVPVTELLAERTVQGFAETGLSAILHVLEHSSGHAGQIYAWTKQALAIDLRFYDL